MELQDKRIVITGAARGMGRRPSGPVRPSWRWTSTTTRDGRPSNVPRRRRTSPRTAAASWGVHGVRMNAILPAIATPMYEEALERMGPEGLEAHRWLNEGSIAMGKAYDDPDLGPVMLFLASDGSRFFTGQASVR